MKNRQSKTLPFYKGAIIILHVKDAFYQRLSNADYYIFFDVKTTDYRNVVLSISFLLTDSNFMPLKNISFAIRSSLSDSKRRKYKEDMSNLFFISFPQCMEIIESYLEEIDFHRIKTAVFVRNMAARKEYPYIFKQEMKKSKLLRKLILDSFPLEFRYDSDDVELFPAVRMDVSFEKMCDLYEVKYIKIKDLKDVYSAEDRNFSMFYLVRNFYRHTKSEREIDAFFSTQKLSKVKKKDLLKKMNSVQKKLDVLLSDQEVLQNGKESELYPHEWISDPRVCSALKKYFKKMNPRKQWEEMEFRKTLDDFALKKIAREIEGLTIKKKALASVLERVEKMDEEY